MNENNITVSDAGKVKELIRYLPTSLRFTIIDWQGDVMYDNLMDASLMENHLNRPEVKKIPRIWRRHAHPSLWQQ